MNKDEMIERFCDDNCIYLSCNERFQNVYYNVNKERPPHVCKKYKKRLYHLEYHPNICKCEKCMKEQQGVKENNNGQR